jgi:hypothetical protein
MIFLSKDRNVTYAPVIASDSLYTQAQSEGDDIHTFNVHHIPWAGCPRKSLDYVYTHQFKNLEKMEN